MWISTNDSNLYNKIRKEVFFVNKPYIIDGQKVTREEYRKTKCDQFITRVPKGQKDIIQVHATEQGESLNAFINRAVNETIERDKQKTSE